MFDVYDECRLKWFNLLPTTVFLHAIWGKDVEAYTKICRTLTLQPDGAKADAIIGGN